MKSVDLVVLLFNRISKPFHVLFAGNSNYLKNTMFQAGKDSFQELGLIYDKAQLNLLDAISNLNSIQVLLDDRAIALTLFYTSFLHLHIGLAQNST